MSDSETSPRILGTEEGMDLFNNSILLRGVGPTPDQALLDARRQAETWKAGANPELNSVDFALFGYLGRMGPERRGLDGKVEYIMYVTYVNREWKARHP